MALGILAPRPQAALTPKCGAPLSGTIDQLKVKALGCKASLGFQKQTQPLPVGRYWIDVSGEEKVAEFVAAMSAASDAGIVVVEDIDQDPPANISFSEALLRRAAGDKMVPAVGALFRVTGAGSISIDATKYGFPTKAPDCLTSHAQTSSAQRAQAEVDRRADENLGSAKTWLIVGGVMVGLYLVSNTLGNVAMAARAVRGK